MTREEFDVLVQRLERISRRNPGVYLLRVVGLVGLAYGYLLLLLLGSLALSLTMVALMVYIPGVAIFGLFAFGGIFFAVARGLWVKIKVPIGQPIKRELAPKLFALLDELRAALDCRPFHEVLIVGSMNAGVLQVPRLGIFGWHRNYLILGLPMMQSLAPEEFKAVLAHEFAHSSRGHGRVGNWLYRVRRSWEQIFEQMAKRRTRLGRGTFKFLQWFWPLFNGHIFVLARANEYEADACSVRLAGPDAAARALIRTRVDTAFFTEKFWPDVFKLAREHQQPPANVMQSFNQSLKAGPAPADAGRWFRQAFLIETNNVDTHPCLKDRLRAIDRLPAGIDEGKFSDPPGVPPHSAAEFFLGGQAEIVTQQISQEWSRSIAKQWTERHEKAKKLAGELASMEKPDDAPPGVARIWEKARKLIELDGDGASLALLAQVIALEPGHAGANFVLGRHFLKSDDIRGVGFIETAITTDPLLTKDGCNLLYAHYNRTGQREKLRPLEHRADEFQKLTSLARLERARVNVTDTFLAHELTTDQITTLQKIFETETDIGLVAVARKQVVHFPKNPYFVIALKLKVSWWKVRVRSNNKYLLQRIMKQVRLPGNFLVLVSERNLEKLGARVFGVPNAVIYERAKEN